MVETEDYLQKMTVHVRLLFETRPATLTVKDIVKASGCSYETIGRITNPNTIGRCRVDNVQKVYQILRKAHDQRSCEFAEFGSNPTRAKANTDLD